MELKTKKRSVWISGCIYSMEVYNVFKLYFSCHHLITVVHVSSMVKCKFQLLFLTVLTNYKHTHYIVFMSEVMLVALNIVIILTNNFSYITWHNYLVILCDVNYSSHLLANIADIIRPYYLGIVWHSADLAY